MIFYIGIVLYSDIHKISAEFMKIKIEYTIPVLLLETVAFLVRGYRQQKLLSSLGIKIPLIQSCKIFIAGYSMVVTPGGAGEIIKSHFFKRNFGTSLSKTFPLVFIERFHDLLAAIIIISVTLFLIFNLQSTIIVIISIILLLGLFTLIRHVKIFTGLQNKLLKIKYLKKIIPGPEFNESVEKLTEYKIMRFSIFISVLSWLIDAISAYFVFLSFGLNLNFIEITQMTFTSTLSGALSFLPGGVGITEGSLIAQLVSKGYQISLASALVLYLRLTSIWFATLFGFIVARDITNRK